MSSASDPTRKQAWEIASDPTATEAKWIAAVTILDNVKEERKLPAPIAAIWATGLSSLGAFGGFMLFTMTQVILSIKLIEIFGDAAACSYLAIAFAIWFVPCIVFNMLFTYQRLSFGGGRAWIGWQYLLTIGFLTAASLWAVDGQPVRPWDAALLAGWNASCLAVTFLACKMAETTYASLNRTIGAKRIVSRLTWSFASLPFVMGALTVGTVTVAGFLGASGPLLVMLSGLMLVTSYVVSRSIGATATKTGAAVASIVWAPFMISNLVLFPVMAATHAWLTLTGGFFVTWIDYAGAALALVASAIAPAVGGALASKHLQAKAALGLHSGEQRMVLADTVSAQSIDPSSLAMSPAMEMSPAPITSLEQSMDNCH